MASRPVSNADILNERDAYMACKLYQMSTMLPRQRNVTCVAIVGAGHGPGICEWLTNAEKAQGKSPEAILEAVVKTKKYKGQDVESLITHVTELPLVDEATAYASSN